MPKLGGSRGSCKKMWTKGPTSKICGRLKLRTGSKIYSQHFRPIPIMVTIIRQQQEKLNFDFCNIITLLKLDQETNIIDRCNKQSSFFLFRLAKFPMYANAKLSRNEWVLTLLSRLLLFFWLCIFFQKKVATYGVSQKVNTLTHTHVLSNWTCHKTTTTTKWWKKRV